MTDLLEAVRALEPRIRELAPSVEEARRLPADLVDAIGETGLWSACIPRAVGGLELPLAEVLDVIEAVSHADGSTGWVSMIYAVSGITFAYIDTDVARGMVATSPLICGVYAPTAKLSPAEGGFTVNGRWAFCSGVDNTSWLSLGAIVPGDPPEHRTITFPASDASVVDTWTVSGLRGTGSHDIEARDVFVPFERTFRFIGGVPATEGPLYLFPALGLLSLGIGAVAIGVARAAIDELVSLAADKTPTGGRRRLADRGHIQMEVAKATSELNAARSYVVDSVANAWTGAERGEQPSIALRTGLRLAATHATRTAARVVDRMYDAGGGTSIYAKSPLQRAFRDIHAVTQHMAVAPATYELTGRILLGVETDTSQL